MPGVMSSAFLIKRGSDLRQEDNWLRARESSWDMNSGILEERLWLGTPGRCALAGSRDGVRDQSGADNE